MAVIAAAIAAGSGSFTAGTTTDSDKTKAAAIISQGELLQEGIQRLIIEHNCADNQISFSNPLITGINGSDVYANPNSPSDLSCNLFQPNGGGLTFPTVTASTQETTDAGHFVFEGSVTFMGLGDANTYSTPDLAGFLPIDSLTLCQQINNLLGLGSYFGGGSYTIPTDSNAGHFTQFYYQYTIIPNNVGDWPTGKMMGCLEEASNNTYLNRAGAGVAAAAPAIANYFFYVVLKVR